jgi:hypothetical protein
MAAQVFLQGGGLVVGQSASMAGQRLHNLNLALLNPDPNLELNPQGKIRMKIKMKIKNG